jgi:hypothetical protein
MANDEVDATDLNTDQLFRQMQLDELADATLITPVDFAHIRPITPQLVYYAIRTKKVTTQRCACGRSCINKDEADDYYRSKKGSVAWPFGKERDAAE